MEEFVVNENELEQISGGAYVGPCFRYQIQKGDCLSVLAQRFGSTVNELAAINGIKNVDLIYEGKYLLIPYRAGKRGFF